MLPNQYTQNIIIKNGQELIKNAFINGEDIITGFQTLNLDQKTRSNYPEIIIPGLINLHCHLAYNKIKLPSQELFPWISELVKIHHMGEGFTPKDFINSAKEALSYGTCFLVDNSNSPEASIAAFKATGLKGILGLEIFGSDPVQAENIFAKKIQELNSLEKIPGLNFTLAPHASYDVSVKLWQLCLDWCNQQQMPLLSHLAESQAEEAWFQNKDSTEAQAAKSFWQELGTLETKLENWQSYPSSTQFLYQNNLLKPLSLLTHLVHATKADLGLIKAAGLGAVSCPRSNLYLKNGLPNYANWQGLDYGLGTDSKASNQDLDLRKEANTIPGLGAAKRLELLTSQAAKILKRNDLGTLDIGKANDYVILEIRNKNINLDLADPFELAMDTDFVHVKEVYINGRCRFQNEKAFN